MLHHLGLHQTTVGQRSHDLGHRPHHHHQSLKGRTILESTFTETWMNGEAESMDREIQFLIVVYDIEFCWLFVTRAWKCRMSATYGDHDEQSQHQPEHQVQVTSQPTCPQRPQDGGQPPNRAPHTLTEASNQAHTHTLSRRIKTEFNMNIFQCYNMTN